jgi:hypothetical protein
MFEHPWEIATANLVQILKPGVQAGEQRQAWEEVQYGIETLVKERLVTGDRQVQNNFLQYSGLTLTTKGEAEAITQKRLPTKLIHSVPQPDRSKEASDQPE